MIKDVLKNKLKDIGYSDDFINNNISKIDNAILTINKEFKNEDVNVITYESPDVAIIRDFLNVDSNYIDTIVIDGNITNNTSMLPTGHSLNVADFYLDQKLCLFFITSDLKIEIIAYIPSEDVISRYRGKKYNEIFSNDRNTIIQDYLDEFIASNRLMQNKARDVLNMLANDFVIDEMVVTDVIPVLKLYNSPENFAEKITNYELKYINRRLNRIEIAEKSVMLKRSSKNIKIGNLTNDPYARLSEVNDYPDFYLNAVAYFWLFSNEKGQEEIGIYTASTGETGLYSENTKKIENDIQEKVREIYIQFTNQLGFPVSENAIKEVLLKLNHQLVVPPIKTILNYAESPSDPIEPLGYRYKVIVDPSEFEGRLYNSIEDNIGRRYKYKLTENVLEDLTTIGNKLDYTDSTGKTIRKQSIADFDQNNNSVIIRRETLIDESNINDLLGYIYDDVDNNGTDNLPVPSIEVDFYFPSTSSEGVKMYNGTNYENIANKMMTANKFYAIEDVQNIFATKQQLEGSTSVVVRYVASNGDVLRENKINNVFPGETYVPEIIPIINDKEGKEWTCKSNTIQRKIVSDSEEDNIIVLEYIGKFAEVNIHFVNSEGSPLAANQKIKMQVGSSIDKNKYLTVVDKEGIEWEFSHTKPAKFAVSEDESHNNISFVYDVTKVNVLINYKDKNGNILKDSTTVKAIANKKYLAKIEPIIEDSNQRAWVYISEAAASIVPLENKENIIDLIYDEMKAKIITSCEDENGNKIVDDNITFLQVGRQYTAEYKERIIDINNALWQYDSINSSIIRVKANESENIIRITYKPVYSKVRIKLINENGNSVSNDIVEDVQVGKTYSAKNIGLIKDIKGRIWNCTESKKIEIVENEKANTLELIYQPLMVSVAVRYVNDEGKDIIPQKTINVQAGDVFKPETLAKLEDSNGKRWKIIDSAIKDFVASEQENENKVEVYYEKELTSVVLSFMDMYSNKLQDDVTIKWQIGAEYNSNAYNRIEDNKKAKWSMISSDPKIMMVKEKHNHFILLYDEVRTKVILRYININDNEPIREPEIITTKLGAKYFPNIQHEYIDSNKLNWIYAGEKELSIITKDEEEENIIVLKYEPHNAKVTVKYIDENGNKITDDNVKEMQIGSQAQIKKVEKVYSKEKLGYQLIHISHTVIRVDDDTSKNVVECVYTPLVSNLMIAYKSSEGNDIIKPIIKSLQVGLVFNAEIINKIIDENGKHWNYIGEDKANICITEEDQTLKLLYEPLLMDVKLNFINLDGQKIIESSDELIQVGEKYIPKISEIIKDSDEKAWVFISSDKNEITVTDNKDDNVITLKYDKKLVQILVSFVNNKNEQIKPVETIKAQQGSILQYEAARTVIDRNGLGWELEESKEQYKVKESDNNYVVKYNPYYVSVFDKYIDEDGEEIVEQHISKHQVGTKHEPAIEGVLIDDEGKEWLHISDNKLFSKGTSIIVSENEEDNDVLIKYRPSLTDVTVMYIDPLGTILKPNDIVKAQIGSMYSAVEVDRITDSNGKKWTYNPNTKNLVKVEREKTLIALSYEEQKALVIYKYQDEYGNRLKTPKKLLAQVGTLYKLEADPIIEDDQGKAWEYKGSDFEQIEIKDAEQDNVFVITYIPLKVEVILNIRNKQGDEIIKPVIMKAQLGSEFKPNVDYNITDDNSLMYKFVKIEPESIKVKETPIGSSENINVFDLTYESVYSTVTVQYHDIDGNQLRDDERKQLQVGTMFTPKKLQFIKDRKENQWQLVTNEDIAIRVKENLKENTIVFSYEIAKTNVIVQYKDTDGNSIHEDDIFNIQIGKEFVPNAPKILFDKSNKKWSFFSSDPVKIKVGSVNNVVTILYQEEKATVLIKYIDENGKQIKNSDRVLAQIGSTFKPKVNNKVIYDENEIWRFSHFEPKELVVSENTSENIISQVYTNKELDEVTTTEDIKENNKQAIKKENKIVDMDEIKPGATITIENPSEQTEESSKEENGYIYLNNKLEAIDNFILLSDKEKMAVDQISVINNNIIKTLNDSIDFDSISHKENKLFDEEKQIINSELNDVIENDKTGSKLLKILEISIQPVEDNSIFSVLQQRKAVIMTDYFFNKQITDAEQALYICSKGKNDKQLEIINSIKDTQKELKTVQLQVVYEKLLLENYYRARSSVKDQYFRDESSKQQLTQEINTLVSKMLVSQTYNLVVKENNSLYQQIELIALKKLLNQMQRDNVIQMINKISDGKQRKNVLKRFQTL